MTIQKVSIKHIAARVAADKTILSDVSTADAAKILNKIFAKHGVNAVCHPNSDNDKNPKYQVIDVDVKTSYTDPESFELILDLKKKSVLIDTFGGSAFNLPKGPAYVQFPDFKNLGKESSAKHFIKWANDVNKVTTSAAERLVAMNTFASGFANAMSDIQALIESNKA